jgi:hypothetical protein
MKLTLALLKRKSFSIPILRRRGIGSRGVSQMGPRRYRFTGGDHISYANISHGPFFTLGVGLGWFVSVQNKGRLSPGSPMFFPGGTKEGDDGAGASGGQMHGGGIDPDIIAGSIEEARHLGPIDQSPGGLGFVAQGGFEFYRLRYFIGRRAGAKNQTIQIRKEFFTYLHPSFQGPPANGLALT